MTPQPVWCWRALWSRFVTALAIISIATASSVAYAYWFANDLIGRTHKVAIDLPGVGSSDPANYLIVGSDSRAFVHDPVAADQFGTQKDLPGNRADVIMIAHVDPHSPGKGFLVSIPRDTWVSIAGHGSAKINAAFNYANGPKTLIDTIENNFRFKINHYLKLDFVTFTDVVRAIGHVHIFFPAPARDFYTGLDIKTPGCVALDSIQALAYARSRHYHYKTATSGNDPRSWPEEGDQDLGRIRRQQSFIRSLAQEAIKAGARNPLTAKALLEKIVPDLEVDRHMDLQAFLGLVRAFRTVDPGAVQMETLPTERQTINGQDAQVVVEAKAQPILDRLKSFTSTADPKPLPKIAHAQIRVQVLNGSGVKGAAGRAETALLTAGFANGGAVGDADRSDYTLTEVRYAPGATDKARVVAAYLGGTGRLVALRSAAGSTDVVVVLGGDFVGVARPGSHPTTSAASTVATVATVAPNPGTTPGITAPRTPAGSPAVGCG
jgi:LCP family protein required for cell wall assembly